MIYTKNGLEAELPDHFLIDYFCPVKTFISIIKSFGDNDSNTVATLEFVFIIAVEVAIVNITVLL